MKKLFFLLTFLFCNLVLQAQNNDYILKKNGDELYGTIKEITPEEIKYSDTLTPQVIRSIRKTEVFMIRLRNGVKEVYGQQEVIQNNQPVLENPRFPGPIVYIGSNDYKIGEKIHQFRYVKTLLLSLEDERIGKLLLQARMLGLFGNILAYSSIFHGMVGLSLVGDSYSYTKAAGVIGTTLILVCVASNSANIIFKIKKKQKLQEALDIYNKRVEEMAVHQ